MKPARQATPIIQQFYSCDFGESHDIHETCGCTEKYRVFPIQYRVAFKEKGYIYAKDIPQSVKHEILNSIPKFA